MFQSLNVSIELVWSRWSRVITEECFGKVSLFLSRKLGRTTISYKRDAWTLGSVERSFVCTHTHLLRFYTQGLGACAVQWLHNCALFSVSRMQTRLSFMPFYPGSFTSFFTDKSLLLLTNVYDQFSLLSFLHCFSWTSWKISIQFCSRFFTSFLNDKIIFFDFDKWKLIERIIAQFIYSKKFSVMLVAKSNQPIDQSLKCNCLNWTEKTMKNKVRPEVRQLLERYLSTRLTHCLKRFH